MIITKSSPLKQFKKQVGQANHFLITILVGLDGVASGELGINSEFHAAWNPENPIASARRSGEFARNSCLAWVVDSLDMYLRLINKSPSIISDLDLKHRIDAEENSRSIHKRLNLVCEKNEIKDVRIALADMLICWRNRLTHYDADNDISVANRELLLTSRELIKEEYRGLDINLSLESFDNKKTPTFKEVASLVSASINLVYAIDKELMTRLNTTLYADEIIIEYLKHDARMLNEVFSNDHKKIEKSLRQILMQHSFTSSDTDNGVDKLCRDLSMLSIDELNMRLHKGTLISA